MSREPDLTIFKELEKNSGEIDEHKKQIIKDLLDSDAYLVAVKQKGRTKIEAGGEWRPHDVILLGDRIEHALNQIMDKFRGRE